MKGKTIEKKKTIRARINWFSLARLTMPVKTE